VSIRFRAPPLTHNFELTTWPSLAVDLCFFINALLFLLYLEFSVCGSFLDPSVRFYFLLTLDPSPGSFHGYPIGPPQSVLVRFYVGVMRSLLSGSDPQMIFLLVARGFFPAPERFPYPGFFLCGDKVYVSVPAMRNCSPGVVLSVIIGVTLFRINSFTEIGTSRTEPRRILAMSQSKTLHILTHECPVSLVPIIFFLPPPISLVFSTGFVFRRDL